MTTKTTRKRKTAPPPEALIETLIYIGPTLQRGRLPHLTTLRSGIPPDLAELAVGIEDFDKLFVPVSRLVAAQQAAQTKGTPEHAAIERLKGAYT
ncbi:hypothetical protein [Paenibacillus xanthanilyticus]|uniref:Uncharacterized protein n=1 Tax=Paenibacillus xanthanilyticus TaxID=1783531 RepID=A0ABV8KA35_9BACL